ncbi:MAG TPA: hypothetical protein VGJ28_08225, partial [Micromonosporaceae bacterium]
WLQLVGMCADPERATGEHLPMVQAAVAAHADRIIGFLHDADDRVAVAAAYALRQCEAEPGVGAALAAHPDLVRAAATLRE